MTHKVADDFFNDIDFVSIISTVKGVMTSDGSMSILLDFERVLDEIDVYAFKNWQLGELVQGPDVGRYGVTCIFMWPYKLMPDPHAVKRLLAIGCKVDYAKNKLKVPIQPKNYDDFIQGTMYPKSTEKEVWFVKIEIPLDLMDDIKEGSIDLADQSIDLEEIDTAYGEDLDKEGTKQDDQVQPGMSGANQPLGGTAPAAPNVAPPV